LGFIDFIFGKELIICSLFLCLNRFLISKALFKKFHFSQSIDPTRFSKSNITVVSFPSITIKSCEFVYCFKKKPVSYPCFSFQYHTISFHFKGLVTKVKIPNRMRVKDKAYYPQAEYKVASRKNELKNAPLAEHGKAMKNLGFEPEKTGGLT
jgi:hypothetical protein